MRLQQFVNQRLAMGNSRPVPVDDPRVIMALKKGERLPLGVDPASGTVNFNKYGKLGWAIGLIFSVCCVLRLARFNLTKFDDNEE